MNEKVRSLLIEVRARLRHQCEVGIISRDPANEDPNHELGELLPDLDYAIEYAAPYMPTMDEAYRFIKSNPKTSADILAEVSATPLT